MWAIIKCFLVPKHSTKLLMVFTPWDLCGSTKYFKRPTEPSQQLIINTDNQEQELVVNFAKIHSSFTVSNFEPELFMQTLPRAIWMLQAVLKRELAHASGVM